MKRKHITLTLEEKYMVIKDREKGMSHSEIARKYNIGRSTVRDIKRKEKEIRTKIMEGLKKRKTLKPSYFKKTEDALFVLLEKRTSGSYISDARLKTIATQFHAKLEPEKPFIASDGWCRRFKDRLGLKIVDDNDNADDSEDEPLARLAKNKYANNGNETKIENSDHLRHADNDIVNNDGIFSYVNINNQKNASHASSEVSESKFASSGESIVTNSQVSLVIEESFIESGEESSPSLLALKSTDILISYSQDHHFPLQDITLLRKLRDKIELTTVSE